MKKPFSSKKAIQLSFKKVIGLIIVALVLIMIFPSIAKTMNLTTDGVSSMTRAKWQQEYEIECNTGNTDSCKMKIRTCPKVDEEKQCDEDDVKRYKAYLEVIDCDKKDDCNEKQQQEWNEFLSDYNIIEDESSSDDNENDQYPTQEEISQAIKTDFFENNKQILENYAQKNNLDVNVIYAIILNEGAYNKNFEETIRFECHQFNKRIGSKRIECTCSNTNYCTHPGEDSFSRVKDETNYDAYLNAKKINSKIAFQSSSFGFAQIMGFNYINLGLEIDYEGGLEKLKNEELQIEYFLAFLEKNGITSPIKEKDWDSIAYKYNGPQYEQTNYHTKLKTNYETLIA